MQLEQDHILWRFSSIIGHLESVIHIVEQDETDEQVISQLLAIRGSIDSLLSLLVRNRVKDSLDALNRETCPEQQAKQIHRLVMMYQRVCK